MLHCLRAAVRTPPPLLKALLNPIPWSCPSLPIGIEWEGEGGGREGAGGREGRGVREGGREAGGGVREGGSRAPLSPLSPLSPDPFPPDAETGRACDSPSRRPPRKLRRTGTLSPGGYAPYNSAVTGRAHDSPEGLRGSGGVGRVEGGGVDGGRGGSGNGGVGGGGGLDSGPTLFDDDISEAAHAIALAEAGVLEVLEQGGLALNGEQVM
ncbi:hypothetical protein T492DRAFT_75774 [Pavlovales sp. CCMP2436]|nr:hypothetical protein T492DRAFT_75774 [Pavlovales sp. CCMP2436]